MRSGSVSAILVVGTPTERGARVDQPLAEGLEDERRRLWDRRSPEPLRRHADRRAGDRRAGTREPPAERRTGSDRRHGERRRGPERRTLNDRRRGVRWHDTPIPYTGEELAELRARYAAGGPVSCPSCGGRVSLGPARRAGTDAETGRLVMCVGCARGAIVPCAGAVRILIVGANEALRDILRAPLARSGHDVAEAADAAVGLAAYAAVPADVVLLDTQAPGRIEPREFLQRLRGSFPDARVVALTRRSSKGEADQATGTDDFIDVRTIPMPISRDDLLRVIDEVRPTN
jgi:CheY-like chemotaxis protein